jgi:hypothetical protein
MRTRPAHIAVGLAFGVGLLVLAIGGMGRMVGIW